MLMANAERRHIRLIQRSYRAHLEAKTRSAAVPLVLAMREQAVRCITQSAHSGEAILFAKLKTDLRKLMEKGRVYKAGSGELIAWGVRFFFGSEKGLCYQHVGRKLRPVGTKKVIPWGAITKVEALEDDSVYVETQALKRYYLKPKDSAQPAVEAWQWATALCRLGVLPPPHSTAPASLAPIARRRPD